MHPEEETVHSLNAQVVRAESERLTSEALVRDDTHVAAESVGLPTGLPVRHRRGGGDSLGWIAAASGVAAVVVVVALAIGGAL